MYSRPIPVGFKARAKITFAVASHLGPKENVFPDYDLVDVPLAGVSVPGLFSLGPSLAIEAGMEITRFEGKVSLTTGATVTMPDSVFLKTDLTEPDNNEHSPCKATFDFDPFDFQARVSASAKIYLAPTLQVGAYCLGYDISTGVEFRLPFFEARAEYIADPNGGACKTEDDLELAVKLSAKYGFEIKYKAEILERKWDFALGTISFPLFEPFCQGFDTSDNEPNEDEEEEAEHGDVEDDAEVEHDGEANDDGEVEDKAEVERRSGG